jgi:hypothetical protein
MCNAKQVTKQRISFPYLILSAQPLIQFDACLLWEGSMTDSACLFSLSKSPSVELLNFSSKSESFYANNHHKQQCVEHDRCPSYTSSIPARPTQMWLCPFFLQQMIRSGASTSETPNHRDWVRHSHLCSAWWSSWLSSSPRKMQNCEPLETRGKEWIGTPCSCVQAIKVSRSTTAALSFCITSS